MDTPSWSRPSPTARHSSTRQLVRPVSVAVTVLGPDAPASSERAWHVLVCAAYAGSVVAIPVGDALASLIPTTTTTLAVGTARACFVSTIGTTLVAVLVTLVIFAVDAFAGYSPSGAASRLVGRAGLAVSYLILTTLLASGAALVGGGLVSSVPFTDSDTGAQVRQHFSFPAIYLDVALGVPFVCLVLALGFASARLIASLRRRRRPAAAAAAERSSKDVEAALESRSLESFDGSSEKRMTGLQPAFVPWPPTSTPSPPGGNSPRTTFDRSGASSLAPPDANRFRVRSFASSPLARSATPNQDPSSMAPRPRQSDAPAVAVEDEGLSADDEAADDDRAAGLVDQMHLPNVDARMDGSIEGRFGPSQWADAEEDDAPLEMRPSSRSSDVVKLSAIPLRPT